MLERLKQEPARIGALLTALVALLVDLGVNIDEGIALRLTALTAIVFGEGVRQKVYTEKSVREAIEAQDPQAPEKSGGGNLINEEDADRLDDVEGY